LNKSKMSGSLRNTRHEAFAKALFERPKTGMTLAQCYESAGYKTKGHSSETMASRLSFAEHIQARVSELQGSVARKAVISIESICAELDEANAVAKAHGQAGAMVSASTLRAKLAGLFKDKVEVSGPDPLSTLSKCETTREFSENMLREMMGIAHPTTEQVEQVEALMCLLYSDLEAVAKGQPPRTINAVALPNRAPLRTRLLRESSY
jgi:hypothetical protein